MRSSAEWLIWTSGIADTNGAGKSTCSYTSFLCLSRGCQRVFVLHNMHKGIQRNDSYNEPLWSNVRYVDTERSLQGKISSIRLYCATEIHFRAAKMHCARIPQKLLMNGKELFYLLFVVFTPRMDKINKFRLKFADVTRSITQQKHYRADSKQ